MVSVYYKECEQLFEFDFILNAIINMKGENVCPAHYYVIFIQDTMTQIG